MLDPDEMNADPQPCEKGGKQNPGPSSGSLAADFFFWFLVQNVKNEE
jgi:hypothetical protein